MKLPYIKLLTEVGDFKVFIVDGFYIRRMSKKYQDFTNFAQHYRFPTLIPSDEFWLDECQHEKEDHFFIDHMLKEYELMAGGMSYDKAFDIADKMEKRERARAVHSSKCKPHPVHIYQVVIKQLPIPPEFLKLEKEWANFTIDLVNGEEVRDRYLTSFTEGGNDKVYTFIPSPWRIWIENYLPPQERAPTILHEGTECIYMSKGLSYHRAHNLALQAEWKWRHKK